MGPRPAEGQGEIGGQAEPPKDNTSEKGKAATKADKMVRVGIALANDLCDLYPNMGLYMENPVGSLAKRGYMKAWIRSGKVVQREVHYCAFGHKYHKPTNIWTNMVEWEPTGTTGTGRCERRCRWGHWAGTSGFINTR